MGSMGFQGPINFCRFADLMTVVHRIHTGKKWGGFGNKKQWLPASFRNPLVTITKKATDKAQ